MFDKALLQGDSAILVKKSDLEKIAPALVENGKPCPTCGVYQLDGFTKDYRNNGGCIGSVIHCYTCASLSDKHYWELRNLKTEEEKQKRFIEILKPGPNHKLIVALENLKEAFLKVLEAHEQTEGVTLAQGYPFPDSFDEVTHKVMDWIENQKMVLNNNGLAQQLDRVAPGWGIAETGGHQLALYKEFDTINDTEMVVMVGCEVATMTWSGEGSYKRPLKLQDFINGDERFFTAEYEEVILPEDSDKPDECAGLLTDVEFEEIASVRKVLREYLK